MRHATIILTLILVGIAALVAASQSLGIFHVSQFVLATTRWIALASLLGYGFVSPSLTTWIILGMLLGGEIGHDFPALALDLRLLANIFLRLIKVIIAPLLFSTLVSGIAGHADLKKVGRMGVKSLIYFELVTTIALFIGLGAINLNKAGVGVKLPAAAGAAQVPAARPTTTDIILHIFPENIAKSVSEGQILQVVVFSMIFGIALAMVDEKKRKPMIAFTESLTEVMFKFTNIVMLLAPIGIAGAIAYTIASTGFSVLYNLGQLVATFYVALFLFVFAVLVPSAWIAGVPLGEFTRAVTEPATIAFSTTSSEAALPR